MATVYWLGTADKAAQIGTFQVTADDAATTYTITVGIGNKSIAVSVVGTGTGVNDTAAALQVVCNAEAHPYFAAITFTVVTDTITLTATTEAVPFTAVSTDTGGTGTIGAYSITTAATGPNFWDNADNWWDVTAADHEVPADGDDVYFRDSDVNVCWNIDQSAANLELLSMHIEQSYTGLIGLDQTQFATSADGATTDSDASEYRDHYLVVGAAEGFIGEHSGIGNPSGSKRIKWHNDDSAVSTLAVINSAASSADTGKPAIRYLNTYVASDINIRKAPGGFGLAADEPGETCSIDNITIDSGSCVVGDGVTLVAFTSLGGSSTLKSAMTTLTVKGGTVTTEGGVTVELTNAYTYSGGTFVANATGPIGTLTWYGGNIDFSKSTKSRTVTNFSAYLSNGSSAGTFRLPSTVTLTNGITPYQDLMFTTSPL